MTFACECGVKLNNPKWPVYCRCGAIHRLGGYSEPPRHAHPGTAAWHKLHRYAVTVHRWSPTDAQAWYEAWVANDVPQGCGCGSKWRQLTEQWQPDFSTRQSFFAWTVEAHNRVNERLGKPLMSLDAALQMYGMWVRKASAVPRVGFLSACYMQSGGTETWNRTLLPRLSKVRVEGLVATYLESGDPAPLRCQYGVGLDSARRLAEAVDVIVAWGIGDLRSLLPENPPKVVLVHHGDLNNEWFEQYIENQAGIASAVVAINPDVADHARTVLPCRVEHIPNAVDPVRATPSQRLEKTRPTVVWCHRFSDEKRVQLAVDAARLMPDWSFILIGDGPDKPKNVPANCSMLGVLPSQADYLAIADVFLSTTWMEGFGLSMAEAMLAGVPVVATPFGLGATDLVHQLSANPTPEEIAATIRQADRSKVDAARQYIQQHHSVATVVDQWERLILELA